MYRLNLAALTTESFVDFYDQQKYFVAPTLWWQIGDRLAATLAFYDLTSTIVFRAAKSNFCRLGSNFCRDISVFRAGVDTWVTGLG